MVSTSVALPIGLRHSVHPLAGGRPGRLSLLSRVRLASSPFRLVQDADALDLLRVQLQQFLEARDGLALSGLRLRFHAGKHIVA